MNTPNDLSIGDLEKSARASFLIIESLCLAASSPSHPLVGRVHEIIKQVKEYTDAIDESVETTRKGCSFADHALSTCRRFWELSSIPQLAGIPVPDFQGVSKDMEDTVESVCQGAGRVRTRFKKVQVALFQIIKDQEGAKNVNGTLISPSAPLRPKDKNLICETGWEKQSLAHCENEDQLRRTVEALSTFVTDMGSFVNWWDSVKLTLDSLRAMSVNMTLGSSVQQVFITEKWQDMKSIYTGYMSTMNAAKDSYPKISFSILNSRPRGVSHATTPFNTVPSILTCSDPSSDAGGAESNATIGSMPDKPGKHLCTEPDINALTRAALTSFALIEPWCQAKRSSDHPVIVTIVNKIVEQAQGYVAAIDTSVETARKGYTFADHAIALCDFMGMRDIPVKQLEQFLEGMVTTADSAYESALQMNEQFTQVRQALLQIARGIPNDEEEIEEKLGVVVSRPVSLIFLNGALRLHRRERQKQGHSLDEVLTQLEQASQDLNKFLENINHFAEWWCSAKMDLYSLRSAIPAITLDGSNPLQQVFVRGKWERVRSKYLQYQTEISLARDYYSELSPSDTVSTSPLSPTLSLGDTLVPKRVSIRRSRPLSPPTDAPKRQNKSQERRTFRGRFLDFVEQLVPHGQGRPR